MNNCTHEELFKALPLIEARIATTSVRYKDRVAHPIKHIAAIAEHYVPSDADTVSTTRLGNISYTESYRDLQQSYRVTEMYKKVTELEISSWNVLFLLRSEVAYIGTEPILP